MDAGGTATDRRRAKTLVYALCCTAAGMAPHWLPSGRSFWPTIVLAVLLGGYSMRTVLLQSLRAAEDSAAAAKAGSRLTDPLAAVDVVVAARDEQAVITRLVEHLAQLDYPEQLLRLWVVDDGSTDRTPELLAGLQEQYPQLRVVRRAADAGGGKSGALNLVLQQLEGRWMLVLDADAQLQCDTLARLIPFAEAGGWAAVQLRKAVANADVNLLTRAQAMASPSYAVTGSCSSVRRCWPAAASTRPR